MITGNDQTITCIDRRDADDNFTLTCTSAGRPHALILYDDARRRSATFVIFHPNGRVANLVQLDLHTGHLYGHYASFSEDGQPIEQGRHTEPTPIIITKD